MLLIPIDMPKRCIDCPCYEPEFSRCNITEDDIPEMDKYSDKYIELFGEGGRYE